MQRAATDVMQSILFSAVLDGIAALKRASGGLPNQLLRDVQAIHPNVTFADLPKELQEALAQSTRAAFTQLLKEGYAVGPRQQVQQSRPMDRVPERQRDRPGPTVAALRADLVRDGAARRGAGSRRRQTGRRTARLKLGAARAKRRGVLRTYIDVSAHGRPPANEVSSAGAICVGHAHIALMSLRRLECSTL